MQTLNYALDLVKGSVEPDMMVLVIGPGMASLALALAPLVRKVLCLDWDVSRLALAEHSLGDLDNVGFRLLNGPALPVPDESADIMFALGPLDLQRVPAPSDLARVLRQGGRLYILQTTENSMDELRSKLATQGLDAVQDEHPEPLLPRAIIYVHKSTP
jgi:ubiquinone/menaquinone biosynthesis C-methylase UbiE